VSDALFRRDGTTFVPLSGATGPWDAGIVHGAPVAALFAGQLVTDGFSMAPLTVELLAAVPMAPLVLDVTEPTGGRRVQRRDAVLAADGREVARAQAVLVRAAELTLPEKALDHDSPFDPTAVPPLDELNTAAAETVGWESFDSGSLVWSPTRIEGDRRTHAWLRLAVPVVEGTGIQGVELAAVTADYAQAAVHRRLSMAEWSFRNTELTVHLAREPVGPWMGLRCEAIVGEVGTGFNTADLFDAEGRVGRSSAALVVEPRT
jgi:hypothetical protein